MIERPLLRPDCACRSRRTYGQRLLSRCALHLPIAWEAVRLKLQTVGFEKGEVFWSEVLQLTGYLTNAMDGGLANGAESGKVHNSSLSVAHLQASVVSFNPTCPTPKLVQASPAHVPLLCASCGLRRPSDCIDGKPGLE